MSASIMQAKGPGPMPANSTMRTPVRGPLARWVEAGAVVVLVKSIIRLLSFQVVYLAEALGFRRSGSLSVTVAASLSISCARKFRHHIAGKQFERLADVLVSVAASPAGWLVS
jgi:hypothetical protein